MSGLFEDLPFARGDTFSGSGNTPVSSLVNNNLIGKEYIIQDDQYNTGLYVTLKVVRNNSGATLQGKRAVKFNLTAGQGATDVAGYSTIGGERSAISDDKLPATGVVTGDLFYVVTRGPVMGTLTLAGDATGTVAVGDFLHATTGATTGATTAGRVGGAVLTGATSVLAAQIAGLIGRAMSTAASTQGGGNILINALPSF